LQGILSKIKRPLSIETEEPIGTRTKEKHLIKEDVFITKEERKLIRHCCK
jgi:hypothetical protein